MRKQLLVLAVGTALYGCGGSSSKQTPMTGAVSNPVTQTPTPAEISGTDLGSVINGKTTVANGVLTITDSQTGEAAFQAQENTEVEFGLFSINTAGEWDFTLVQSAALSALTTNQQVAVEVLSVDGTSHTITITVGAAELNNDNYFAPNSEVTLDSDGPNKGLSAYRLIENVFAQGSIETPDFYPSNHTSVEHILEDDDEIVGPHFVFLAHRDLDHDKGGAPSDRQRNEIKSYDKSDETLKAYLNDTFQYSWKFKVTSQMQLSSRFSHFFQIKAKNYSEENINGNDNQPIFTLSGAEKSSTGNELQVRYNSGYDTNGNSTRDEYLSTVEWSLITDEWVEVFVQITYAEEGRFKLSLTRLSDELSIIDIDNQNIDTWRGVEEKDFVRPKWGIYRSILETDSLREAEEQVRFANFSIKKGKITE